MKTVLICGGRDFKASKESYALACSQIDKIINDEWPFEYLPDVEIIHGGARGADQLGTEYSVINWTPLRLFPADWNKYKKAAGAIRNQQMIDEGKPDLVIAFPGGKGTADMIVRAKKHNIKVVEIGQ